MTALFPLAHADRVKRRVLLALELVDPVTGQLAGEQMTVTAPGFRPPTITKLGQFVWIDPEPPANRTVTIEAVATRGQFAPYSATVAVPMRAPQTPVLVQRATLTPTGLYEPPAGRLGVAGMLVEDAAVDPPVPVADAKVKIMLQSASDAGPLDGAYTGVTDVRGGFVAMVGSLGDDAPMPRVPTTADPRVADGAIIGWISVERAGAPRFSALLPMRRNQLFRAPTPFGWAALSATEPTLPPAP
ncbi:hypothetical protein BRX37_11215 [Sphingomonas sp. S-NIH.Pt3_0716]|nr:hypothetical protein BRX37_11215 [Sphingomonas sp. S-NIH.Pt3_0716]